MPISVSVAVLAVAGCLCAFLLTARADLALLPQALSDTQRGAFQRLDRLQAAADALPDRVVPLVVQAAQAEIRHGVDLAGGKVDALISRADFRMGQTLAVFDQHLGAFNTSLSRTADSVAGVRQDILPALGSANALLRTYQELPDRIGGQLAPSFYALQPEITCRTLAGDGYGGCWHSRITGLMGEAVRVGGVFTQEFPKFSTSLNGIMFDAHSWTAKYVQPHPMKVGDYFKGAGKITLGLGMAGLRGGIF